MDFRKVEHCQAEHLLVSRDVKSVFLSVENTTKYIERKRVFFSHVFHHVFQMIFTRITLDFSIFHLFRCNTYRQ